MQNNLPENWLQVAPGVGNTKPPAHRPVASKKWVFTCNNYTDTEVNIIRNTIGSLGSYFFGYEVGEEGTPHLQGFVEFNKKCRPLECIKSTRFHWEKMKGDINSNLQYCSKERVWETNFYEPLIDPMEGLTFKPWQTEIAQIIQGPVDDRKIYWYWEKNGGVGKTSFAKHLCIKNKNKMIYVSGKVADVKFGIAKFVLSHTNIKAVMFDVCRSHEDEISYEALESIKNGIFFSSKYESDMCIFNPPHIIVFANFAPDQRALSKDRWVITEIKE